MMEIYGTIQFRLILPHIPGFQQEPLPEPVCSPVALLVWDQVVAGSNPVAPTYS